MLTDLAAWKAALAGMADPWVVALALALTTLLVEDLAIAAGAALATQGTLPWGWAFVAVAGGIAAGDLGLYAAGAAARRVALLERRLIGPRSGQLSDRLTRHLPSAVLLARVIPGLRLLTYTACGFLRVNLVAFGALVVLAVGAWTAGLFALSAAVGAWISAALGVSPPLAVALPVVAFALAVPLLQRARAASRSRRQTHPVRQT